jgi:hypothetical protein
MHRPSCLLSGAREPGQESQGAGMGGNTDVVRGLGGRGGGADGGGGGILGCGRQLCPQMRGR